MPTSQLSPKTLERLALLFAPDDRYKVSKLLIEQCGNSLPFLEELDEFQLERFRFAVLKLSEGELGKLMDAITLAKTDWRDLLVAAEFADSLTAHETWQPEQKWS